MNTPIELPHSEESEAAVLGALLINPDAMRDVRGALKPKDFFILRHQYIFEAMITVADRGEIADYVVLKEELRARGMLDKIGSAGYLLNLANQCSTSTNVSTYVSMVARSAGRRKLLEAAEKIRKLALDEEITLENAQSKSAAVLDTASDSQTAFEPVAMKDAVNDFFHETENTVGLFGKVTGIETGLDDWDDILDGFQPGSLNMIGARPGMGKTALLVNIARQVALCHGAVYFWTGEMPVIQLQKRFMALESNINSSKLRRQFRPGGLDQSDWRKFVEAAPRLSALPIFFDPTPGITPAQIRARCERLSRRHGGLALVIVDYVGLMQAGFKKDNREQEISYISRQLKELAMETAPVCAAVQLNRAVENRSDKRPQLADMRDSGAQEQDADTVTFIYRDAQYNENPLNKNSCELIVAKNRHGEIRTANVYADMAQSRFSNSHSISLEELRA